MNRKIKDDSKTYQNLRLLYLLKILWEETDENHGLTQDELMKKLNSNDSHVCRQTLVKNMAELNDFFERSDQCMRIQQKSLNEEEKIQWKDLDGDNTRKIYALVDRDADLFGIHDLKLIEGAVHASHDISRDKSMEIVQKLKKLTSDSNQNILTEKDPDEHRIKGDNQAISYHMESIIEGIQKNRKLRFLYKSQNNKETYEYTVSPRFLYYCNESWYLYCAMSIEKNSDKPYTFRLDRIKGSVIVENERRDPCPKWAKDGEPLTVPGEFKLTPVTLKCIDTKSNLDKIHELFGKNVSITPLTAQNENKSFFQVDMKMYLNKDFIGWVTNNSSWVQVTGNETAVKRMRRITENLSKYYGGRNSRN